MDDDVARYIVTGRVRPAGTVCPAVGSPFESAMAAEAARGSAGSAITAAVLPPAVRQALGAG